MTRVLHFVSGGFSGATQVALDLVKASLGHATIEPLLVLRHKRQTDPARYTALRDAGIPLRVVGGTLNLQSIWQLKQICEQFKPDVLVAHGFPEHIIGRHAGVCAKVPHLIQVEHNSRERYSWFRLKQSQWLAQRTDHIVGVSEGVKAHLLGLGFPADKVMCIANGIDVAHFLPAQPLPLVTREKAIVMAARFAKQKDHITLIRAVAQIVKSGHPEVQLYLAGGGKQSYKDAARALVRELDIQHNVQFLGHCPDMPALLQRCAVCVLSTHYEGLALSAIEGMAAGCLTMGSDVVGVQEIIQHGQNGYLFAQGDATALAAHLLHAFSQPQQVQTLADAGMATAQGLYDRQRMLADYMALLQ
jgi:glycosyltransferase involved in cell wall biosynthesis